MRSPLLIKITREILKELLSQCKPAQLTVFRQMYDFHNVYETIDEIVDTLDVSKLDTAVDQVDRTIQNNKKEELLPENFPF